MKELISIAVLISTLFGGTLAARKIYSSMREAAFSKAAQGLPPLSNFARTLTKGSNQGERGHR